MGAWSRLADGLQNVVTGLGTRRDARTARAYSATIMDQGTVDAAYRGSGMLRKVIDIPALDTVREWRDWQAEADEITALEAEERRLGLRHKVRQAEIVRGLGGGALVLGVPGEPAMPANVRAIGTQGLAFIHVVSRWQLTLGDIVDDPGDALFGGPCEFRMQTGKGEVRIHPSRVICFKGDSLPSIISAGADDVFWGEGRIARVLDACLNLDEALASFSAIIKNARNLKIGIPKMLDLVATDAGEATLMKRLGLMGTGASIINATVYDAGDAEGKGGEKLDYDQVTWAGIPEIVRVFAEALSAAADIPMTRLWGKAAEGMSASGDSQQRDWNKLIRARQELDTRPCLELLDPMLAASAGVSNSDLWWQWAPLDVPAEKEQADTFKTFMEAAKSLQDTGSIPDVAFTKAMQNTAVERGWLAGLDGALAEIPETERFGLNPNPDETDPSALQEGGGPPSGRRGAMEAPRRRAANDARFTDAAPRTLYVQRKLLNAADLIKWAKAQGFDTTASADELHVTIAYSRTPVDWMKIGADWSSDKDGKLTVNAGGPRLVEPLGDKGAVVLLFSSSDLKWRHEAMKEAGASFDFDEYQPHVTITYAKPDGLDLAGVEPYAGPLVFGPELFAELDEGWRPDEREVDDKSGHPFADGKRRRGHRGGNYHETDHPRGPHGKWTSKGSGTIQQHATRALGSGKEHSTTSLGQVSEANAAKVLKQTGVSIAGHERIVQSSDIRHTIRSHGDPAIEAARGQVAVGKQDIAQIPRIVESAHTVRAIGEPGARKHQRLEYVANLDGHEYHYVEEVRPNKVVALKTMRKRVESGARGE